MKRFGILAKSKNMYLRDSKLPYGTWRGFCFSVLCTPEFPIKKMANNNMALVYNWVLCYIHISRCCVLTYVIYNRLFKTFSKVKLFSVHQLALYLWLCNYVVIYHTRLKLGSVEIVSNITDTPTWEYHN